MKLGKLLSAIFHPRGEEHQQISNENQVWVREEERRQFEEVRQRVERLEHQLKIDVPPKPRTGQ